MAFIAMYFSLFLSNPTKQQKNMYWISEPTVSVNFARLKANKKMTMLRNM